MRKLEVDVGSYTPLGPEDSVTRSRVKLATAKLITVLDHREDGSLGVEHHSVYGSALVMPQMARSAGWPKELVQLCVRSYFLLSLTLCLQGAMVMLLNHEEAVIDRFSDQMSLCEFGVAMGHCPDGPGCTGPGGTLYTPSRLYGYSAWVTRTFLKTSLESLFPDSADDINKRVDPGEYGVESALCRLLCISLFSLSLLGEGSGILSMARLLWVLPSRPDPWLDYKEPDWDANKQTAKAMRGYSELDLIELKVAGMPRVWKVINAMVLLVPKFLMWYWTLCAGADFLSETSSINNTIVNSTALAFILNIDELLFTVMTTDATRHIMQNIEGVTLYDQEREENLPDDEVMKEYLRTRSQNVLQLCIAMVPFRLVCNVGLAFLAVFAYYSEHCDRDPKSGFWVSKSMHYPTSVDYKPLEDFFPLIFPKEELEKPYWTWSQVVSQATN